MFIYPLVWVVKLAGTHVVAGRIYTYVLNFAAYIMIIYFLYRTIRLKTAFVLSALVYIIAFFPISFAPNTSIVRFVLGILPILLVYIYSEKNRKYLVVISGLTVGQSLLFSQEAGLCSLVAVIGMFFLSAVTDRDWRKFITDSSLFVSACLISVIPMLA